MKLNDERTDIVVNCEGPARPRTIVYRAPDPVELQRARERRIKELKMYDILREIFFYVVYIWVIIVISYEFRDPRSFQFRENLRRAFVTGGRSTAISSQTSLELVSELLLHAADLIKTLVCIVMKLGTKLVSTYAV